MHVMDKVAVVSCHVERPLDDRTWAAFSEFQARRPGGFAIAALMRPPDADESETLWLARARIEALGAAGRTRALAEFSEERCIDRTEALYRKVLA